MCRKLEDIRHMIQSCVTDNLTKGTCITCILVGPERPADVVEMIFTAIQVICARLAFSMHLSIDHRLTRIKSFTRFQRPLYARYGALGL
jgi:hypothetical protein